MVIGFYQKALRTRKKCEDNLPPPGISLRFRCFHDETQSIETQRPFRFYGQRLISWVGKVLLLMFKSCLNDKWSRIVVQEQLYKMIIVQGTIVHIRVIQGTVVLYDSVPINDCTEAKTTFAKAGMENIFTLHLKASKTQKL